MPTYLIERSIPGAGALTADELAHISRTSVGVLAGMGGRAEWLHSYVIDDKIMCVYRAADPEAIREHGAAGGFPVDAIHPVRNVIDPTTGALEGEAEVAAGTAAGSR